MFFPVAVAIWALTAPLDRRKVVLHRFTCFWAALYTWLNPAWRVTIHGREKIDPDRAVVFVANHLSLVDIFVMFRLFTHFKWVSKVENFRVPFIGWNMSLNGYIRLVRGQKQSVVRMMQLPQHARITASRRTCTLRLSHGQRRPASFAEAGISVIFRLTSPAHQTSQRYGRRRRLTGSGEPFPQFTLN